MRYLTVYVKKKSIYKKILNCIVWGVSYVEVTGVTLCEQVPNGRTTTSNNTVCQPILWKKPIKIGMNCYAMENLKIMIKKNFD